MMHERLKLLKHISETERVVSRRGNPMREKKKRRIVIRRYIVALVEIIVMII